MKKFIVLLFLLLPTFLLAQEPKKMFWDNWSININGGQTLFLGDVSRNFEIYRPSFNESSTAVGLTIAKDLSCVFSLRGQVFTGSLFGQKDYFKGGAPANLKFNAIFWNYNINTTINLSRLFGKCNPDRKFLFYGILGVGFTDFKTRLYNTEANQEISSWGYGRPSNGTYYWVTETTIPLGLGMSYKLGKRLIITLESTLNGVNTEKLDRVKGMFDKDGYYYTSLGVTFNLSKFNRVCDCKKSQPGVIDNVIPDNKQVNQMQREIDSLKMSNQVNKMQNVIDSLKNKLQVNDVLKGMQNVIDSLKKRIEINEMQNEIDNLKRKLQEKSATPDVAPNNNINANNTNKENVINNIIDQVINDVKDTIEKSGYLLYSVYFDVNKWDIKPHELVKIAAVAETLEKNPTLNVKIIGNADRQGGYNYNIWLSKQRAESVAKTLTKDYNIKPNRYVLDWKGYTEPLSMKYFYINRRVDFLKLNP